MIFKRRHINEFGRFMEDHSRLTPMRYMVNDLDILISDPFIIFKKQGWNDSRKADRFFLKREEKVDATDYPFD